MSYFYLNQIITATLLSNREYTSSSKTPYNGTKNFYKNTKNMCSHVPNKTICKHQCQIYKTKSYSLLILLNTNIKREYIVIPIIPIGEYFYI